ncbi:hypothetical protein [Variovorax guangxiensis]|uniref:Uncharacterized protein n=1 Tax=Variovorax guangxiensis TaxID=1775474 RepID=A0A840FLK4_9BURK|nr:hypothetical protein [Variovorax guangxiensis]MBB4223446.1 hypothetical protein [Variovorax guangxiensis]
MNHLNFPYSGKAMSLESLKEFSSRVFYQPDTGAMVKEVVSFAPPYDPYRKLAEASKRVAEGKSVFGSDAEKVPTLG